MIAGALAPAKINLGLEILGRRSDGYHEIRTILAAISLYDRLLIRPSGGPAVETDVDVGPDDRNLVTIAARSLIEKNAEIAPSIELQKRIPSAAGLGGASSDAAATLLALDRLYGLTLSIDELSTLSAGVGSDAPFFVSGGVALAGGRGEQLDQLERTIDAYAVIVAPRVSIPAKTQTLYRSITPDDFTDGQTVLRAFKALETGALPEPEALRNAFERPLYERIPWLRDVPAAMRSTGANSVAVSGAGPAHYALEAEFERATALGHRLADRFGDSASVFVSRLVPHGVLVELASSETGIRAWCERLDPTTDSARSSKFDHNRANPV